MCFPCLKKKPDIRDIEPMADLSDQYEYIVEKYTVKKVPLLLANTAEDIIERQEELQLGEARSSNQEIIKDEIINFHMSQELYNMQRVPPCITIAANAVCPARRTMKEKPRPCDVLESMSPVSRPNVKNSNYVVIPTKGSLRSRDIMITKREITNQYLNNFSSVFVDNLKDQIPKDPECLPQLSRPYTSAFKSLPFGETFFKGKATGGKKVKKSKVQKVAYSFQNVDLDENDELEEKKKNLDDDEDDEDDDNDDDEDDNDDEDVYDDEMFEGEEGEERYYETDTCSKGHTTDAPESEYQDDNENYTTDNGNANESSIIPDFSSANSCKDGFEGAVNRFKTTINTSNEYDNCSRSQQSECTGSQKEESKMTYEDIQALDVGYEFTSCEKLGVKPKMTRIHYPHETERIKELKQASETKSIRKSFFIPDSFSFLQSSPKYLERSKQYARLSDHNILGSSNNNHNNAVNNNIQQSSSSNIDLTSSSNKNIKKENNLIKKNNFVKNDVINVTKTEKEEFDEDEDEHILKTKSYVLSSSTVLESRSEESKTNFEMKSSDLTKGSNIDESVHEISKLYDLAMPANTKKRLFSESFNSPKSYNVQEITCPMFPIPSRSRSFQEGGRMVTTTTKDSTGTEVKGNDYSSLSTRSFENGQSLLPESNEPEVIDTTSLVTRESKTSSSEVTPSRSLTKDEGKRATLRWKIIIKHHREDDSSKKNVNKNVKL